jgi:hypothetical protein
MGWSRSQPALDHVDEFASADQITLAIRGLGNIGGPMLE